jgi:hypothetical protein
MAARLMDDYMKSPPISSAAGQPHRPGSPDTHINPVGQALTKQISWPQTSNNVVLMLSDDEDEE